MSKLNGTVFVTVAITISVACITAAEEHVDNSRQELIESGRQRFASECGFCHGRDAQGGSRGLDLTRSELLVADPEGKLIMRLVKRGRVEKGMPAFNNIDEPGLQAIIAFIQNQKRVVESLNGNRRSVLPEDLAVGDVESGEKYFNSNCSGCHSANGDMAGIANRLQGLPLLRRMLYPGSEGRNASRKLPALSVTTAAGREYTGELVYRDEFTVAMTDAEGNYLSWAIKNISYEINDPLGAHVRQLGRYTDKDIHNVYTFLSTLKKP